MELGEHLALSFLCFSLPEFAAGALELFVELEENL